VGVAASKKKQKRYEIKEATALKKMFGFLRHTHTLAQLSLCYFYRLPFQLDFA